ncbi:MAG: N-6 DNA methylase [Acidimicrobiaceae bacterium]|nr:N-6 DNA methylase [Acidimicrobiaceae bacterium]
MEGFATAVRARGRVGGFNEETLTAPVRELIEEIAASMGIKGLLVVDKAPVVVGDVSLGVPDISAYHRGLLRLVIELKSPGRGADPTRFTGREHSQWQRYSQLPNVVYTDGNTWTLWRAGDIWGPALEICSDLNDLNAAVTPDPQEVLRFFGDVLSWTPPRVVSTHQLAEQVAGRCRALRSDVNALPEEVLRGLTSDWREMLFPELEDKQFVDAYTQTVAFALLSASGLGIDLSMNLDPVKYDRLGLLLHHAAESLGAERGVLGRALMMLTADSRVRSAAAASLDAMIALAAAVDWDKMRGSGHSDDWMDFYETFLDAYDPELRKLAGSYYTPKPVVEWMADFTDRILVERFGLASGYGSDDVTVVDPALGTGTYLVSILDRIAGSVTASVGSGHAGAAINAAVSERVIGFEIQACPYAVAQLRLVETLKARDPKLRVEEPAVYLTDTLADPDASAGQQMLFMRAITESRKKADRIKRKTPVTVVIGNPPYLAGAGQSSWVARELLGDWQPDTEWGVGTHAKNLSNLYVYFWRWAAWKVFENSQQGPQDQAGIVSFITPTGWLDGDGFQQMRRWLREWSSHIWILDLSPEGHQAPAKTQVFKAMRQPVAVVTAVRAPEHDGACEVRYHRVPAGERSAKFAHIADLTELEDTRWRLLAPDPLGDRGSFTPAASSAWLQMPAVDDLLPWNASGMMVGRTWPVAPDRDTLQDRYAALLSQPNDSEMTRHLDEHKRDRTIDTELVDNLTSDCTRPGPLRQRQPRSAPVVEYGYRSFDRHYVIRDKRLINRPNPSLWAAHGDQQIYLAAPALGTASSRPKIAGSGGQIISFSAQIPDMHYLAGSRAGRIHPVWLDSQSATPNCEPGLLRLLSEKAGREVSALDVPAYIAAVAAHPGFTAVYRDDLLDAKSMRVPLTADPELFDHAAGLGRRILYLSTFGQRCRPPEAPPGCPRAPGGPTLETPMPAKPESLRHDQAARTLTIAGRGIDGSPASGIVANVAVEVFDYSVSTMNVLQSWFDYRKHEPSGKKGSPLDYMVPETWRTRYTDDLIDLLHVLTLLVDARPEQRRLLDEIKAGPLIGLDTLKAAGALPGVKGTRAKPAEFEPGRQSPTLDV